MEYWKVEVNQKSLELIATMDVCEFKITIEWTKRLKKENADLNTRLHSKANDLKKSTKTIERLQLSVQEMSCHVPITQE